MAKYKIGDRVRVVNDESTFAEEGECGTIISIERNGMFDYAVRMDKACKVYHDCCGKTENHYGQWLSDKNIELISNIASENAKREFKVIIASKGDTTTAKLMHGKEVAREAKVNRYYKDEYSEEAAIAAIMDKLFPLVLPKEQPKKYFTGRVVCIEDDALFSFTSDPAFLKGNVYCINDGTIYGEGLLKIGNIESVELLNRLCNRHKFIELKG